jgi:hypothetical protein
LLPFSRRLNLWKISKISICSRCFAESIGVLLVKIGRTVENLFKNGLFYNNCFLAPLDWNFKKVRRFQFAPLVSLNRSVCDLWKSVERLKSYSKRGVFAENCSLAPLNWNFEKNFDLVLFLLFCWIDRCILLVKIGRTVKKLFKRGVFEESAP